MHGWFGSKVLHPDPLARQTPALGNFSRGTKQVVHLSRGEQVAHSSPHSRHWPSDKYSLLWQAVHLSRAVHSVHSGLQLSHLSRPTNMLVAVQVRHFSLSEQVLQLSPHIRQTPWSLYMVGNLHSAHAVREVHLLQFSWQAEHLPPSTKNGPVTQVLQMVADEHESQLAPQGIHSPFLRKVDLFLHRVQL